jgi:enediyne biosynthesis protein E4
MSKTRNRWARWGGTGLVVLLLATAAAAGSAWYRAHRRRIELGEARQAMAAGRLALARERLARLADQWPGDGDVLLLLGQCELDRGLHDGELDPRAREAALAAWARVPPSSPDFPAAALLQALQLIKAGRYAQAERLLDAALAAPLADAGLRYDLERALSRVYRFEGRMVDVRRVLRASWCRSFGRTPDAAGVLKELWLLDRSPMPVEAVQGEFTKADERDDGLWLGRANYAILTGRFTAAGGWLDRVLERRPADTAVWRAKLGLAQGTGDVSGVHSAAAHLPAELLGPGDIHSLRAWLAGRLGDADVERRELTDLVRSDPGNAPAIERLAVLSLQAGQPRVSEDYRRRKAEIDRAQDRARKLLLNADYASHATELAGLCRTLGREFETFGWSLVAEAGSGAAAPPAVLIRAMALSAPYAAGSASATPTTGPTVAERLSDLRGPVATARHTEPTAGEPTTAGPSPRFVDEAEAVGLHFTFDSGQTYRHLLPETMSGGLGLLDYDGDGWLDVYCVQGELLLEEDGGPASGAAGDVARAKLGRRVISGRDRLFRNRGDGTFEDATERSRIAAIAWGHGYGMGVAVGDYDNDGDPDLFVSRVDAYALYRNRGDGTFEDVTAATGLAGRRDNPTSAALADLDGDGDLDLYVCHYMVWDAANPPTCRNERGEYFYCDPSKVEPAPDHAFRNDGGRFVEVTAESGLAESGGRGLGVVAADLDDDNRVDLYVANDGTANYLFHNTGGFRFEEVALEAGVAGSASGGYQAGMGVACGDLDGDGRPDLLVTNFYGEGTTYYQNLGQGLFADRSGASGLGLATRYLLGFGIALADVVNSGRPDVLITNGHVNDNRPYFPYAMPARLYANRPDGRLVDISKEAGACWEVSRVGRGLAAGDIDNDGRPDALILGQNEPLAYFHNRTDRVGRFVTFRLEGTKSNRDGVGARVTVTAGGRRLVAQRLGGGSYQSASDPRLHFGLGDAARVDSVEVRWPSGRIDRHEGLPAGTGYLLGEGDPKPRPLAGFVQPPR